MKETAALNVDKEALALYKNEGFEEHLRKRLSTELAERIMTILEDEPEIVIRQSELRVEEFIPTNSVIYRRFFEWKRLVRCKDCMHNPHETWFECPMAHLSDEQRPEDAWCWRGERKEENGQLNQQASGD